MTVDEKRAEVGRTQEQAVDATHAAQEAAAEATEAVEAANVAVKNYWAARDAEIAARYEAAEALRLKRRG